MWPLYLVLFVRVYWDISRYGRLGLCVPTCLISKGGFLPPKQCTPIYSAHEAQQYNPSITPILLSHTSTFMFLFGAEARRVIVFFSSIFFHNGAHDVTNHTSFCFSPPKQIKKNHSTASLCGVLVHASNVFFKLYSQLHKHVMLTESVFGLSRACLL